MGPAGFTRVSTSGDAGACGTRGSNRCAVGITRGSRNASRADRPRYEGGHVTTSLHILHLEDDPADAVLVRATLEAAGIVCAITLVQDRETFVATLEHGGVDLVLADVRLPAFDGLAALDIVRARWPDIPVILVSGTVGEEFAIDSLKRGATDYVLKERLARLVPAVRRARLEADARVDHQRLEAQFIDAQKREVIGQLTAGVAHDFNNVLAIIMGYTDVIAAALDPASPLLHFAEEIQHASERAAGLARQLLVFSGTPTVLPTVLDLNAVVTGLDSMLRRLIDEKIVMTLVPGPSLGRIKADAGYIGQVLMNLVINARDAMPAGGSLVIATRNITIDDDGARTHGGARPGDYVMLSVSDTGTGMTGEVKAHVFEPFFTTKPKGEGTGLGLATCRTIVKQSGGSITLHSDVGVGTTVRAYFPRVEQALDVDAGPVQTSSAPRGTETVLLVEDEPALSRMARRILEGQGYHVLSASNGQEGLRVAQAHTGAPIRLVLTDVVMPLMSGSVMAEWLKTTSPGLRILFTSGHTDDTVAQLGAREPGIAFLPKPYSAGTLARKVREMLDAPV